MSDMKLKPIETAPKDGQIIVLATIDEESVMIREARWESKLGRWTWPWYCDMVPKFWMPIPKLPNENISAEG